MVDNRHAQRLDADNPGVRTFIDQQPTPPSATIHRVNLLAELAEVRQRLKEALARSAELLAQPVPDTFLGRPSASVRKDEVDCHFGDEPAGADAVTARGDTAQR
jgi:hypothetical protein